jgi:hypothetical protein
MFDWLKKKVRSDSEPERSRQPESEPQFRPAKLPPRRPEAVQPATISPNSHDAPSGRLQDHEIFLNYLTKAFGQEETILRHESPDGGRAVTVSSIAINQGQA